MGSNQYIDEWETYKRVLDESKVVDKTTWLDIRGNHGENRNIIWYVVCQGKSD